MSVIVTPTDQFICVSSYAQDNFEFGTPPEDTPDDVRISRYANQLLRVLGDDLIVWGGSPLSVNINIPLTAVTVYISEGALIQDTTLIPFEAFHLSRGFSFSPDYTTDIIVVYTDFEFTEADRDDPIDPCPFHFRVGWLSALNLPGGWNPDNNRMVVRAYDIATTTWLDEVTIDGTIYTCGGPTLDPIDGGVLS